jgi:hypothetical protein
MPLSIPCPQCKKSIGLSVTTLGKMIKCPSCGRSFVAGGDDGEPKELVAPITPQAAPVPSPASRKAKPAVRRKQGALRALVFLVGLVGAAGAGLLASHLLAQVRPDLGIPALDFEPLNPYVKAASLENESLHVRTVTAYVLVGAVALGVLGSLLALGGPGLVPMFFFLAAFAAPLILNDRALPFMIPFIVAGVMSIALKARGRRSPLRLLFQVAGGVLAGVLIMMAFLTKIQPPAQPVPPPVVQPDNSKTSTAE